MDSLIFVMQFAEAAKLLAVAKQAEIASALLAAAIEKSNKVDESAGSDAKQAARVATNAVKDVYVILRQVWAQIES